MKVYKIMDKDTGLYSTGGIDPKWTKQGKTWNGMNHVKNHLRQFCEESWPDKLWYNGIPDSWIIQEYLVSESLINNLSAKHQYPLR